MNAGKRWLTYVCLWAVTGAAALVAQAQVDNRQFDNRQFSGNQSGGGQQAGGQQGGGQYGNGQYGGAPSGNNQYGPGPTGVPQYPNPQFGPQPRVADNRPLAIPRPMQPEWLPISREEEEYIDQLLKFWEFKSGNIQRYRCRFKRWQYDPVFGPRDTFFTYSEGAVQYSAPDKGLFKVDAMVFYTPPAAPGERPKYVTRPGDSGEHWVCDGHYIYEFDAKQEKLFQRELPPEMRGKAIVDGPLPFLFGAKADQIKQRYWVHVTTPRDAKDEYWLEAVPKTAQDAANFKKVGIILAKEDYLPKAIEIYPVNYDERTNPARTVFQFERREIDFRDLADLIPFNKQFFDPATPSGWERVVEPYRGGE
jgi:TIGR03009 family protein